MQIQRGSRIGREIARYEMLLRVPKQPLHLCPGAGEARHRGSWFWLCWGEQSTRPGCWAPGWTPLFPCTWQEQGLREGKAPRDPSRTHFADDSNSPSLVLLALYSRSSTDRQFL